MKIQLSRSVTALLGLMQAMLVQNYRGGFFTEINIATEPTASLERQDPKYQVNGRVILPDQQWERHFTVTAKHFEDPRIFELSMWIEGERGGSNFASFHYEHERWDWSPVMKG